MPYCCYGKSAQHQHSGTIPPWWNREQAFPAHTGGTLLIEAVDEAAFV